MSLLEIKLRKSLQDLWHLPVQTMSVSFKFGVGRRTRLSVMKLILHDRYDPVSLAAQDRTFGLDDFRVACQFNLQKLACVLLLLWS